MSASFKGYACQWTRQHDAGKNSVVQECNEHCASARAELYELFADIFDDYRRLHFDRWGTVDDRDRHGGVPDIGMSLKSGNREELAEVKSTHECPSRYPHCSAPGGRSRAAGVCPANCAACGRGRGRLVDQRASTVQAGVLRNLAKLDRNFGGCDAGVIGPLQQRLIDLGGLRPLVIGAFGGVNREWHQLLSTLAEDAAPAMKSQMLCPSTDFCAGVLRLQLRTRLCFVNARARSHLRHARLQALRLGSGSHGTSPGYRRRRTEDFEAAHTRHQGPSYTHHHTNTPHRHR